MISRMMRLTGYGTMTAAAAVALLVAAGRIRVRVAVRTAGTEPVRCVPGRGR